MLVTFVCMAGVLVVLITGQGRGRWIVPTHAVRPTQSVTGWGDALAVAPGSVIILFETSGDGVVEGAFPTGTTNLVRERLVLST